MTRECRCQSLGGINHLAGKAAGADCFLRRVCDLVRNVVRHRLTVRRCLLHMIPSAWLQEVHVVAWHYMICSRARSIGFHYVSTACGRRASWQAVHLECLREQVFPYGKDPKSCMRNEGGPILIIGIVRGSRLYMADRDVVIWQLAFDKASEVVLMNVIDDFFDIFE